MNPEAQPTPNEVEMSAYRTKAAAEEKAAIVEATKVLGPGADAYAYWVITDKLGDQMPVRIPTCRRDGSGWQPPAPQPMERMAGHPNGFTDKDGVRHDPFRFEVSFQCLHDRSPRSAEQLAAARVIREQKKLEEIKRDIPLFPEMAAGFAR